MRFSFRVRAFVFVCWLEWVLILLVSFWGSLLFFDRVHFVTLTIHTFFSFQYSYSLHSWTLPKRGIFVDPPKEHRAFLLHDYFFAVLLTPLKWVGAADGMGVRRWLGWEAKKRKKEKKRGDLQERCWVFGQGREQKERRKLAGEGDSLSWIFREDSWRRAWVKGGTHSN